METIENETTVLRHGVFGDVISGYSRKSAIDDGVLISLDELAREVGIKFPLCVTSAVWHDVLDRNDIPETDTVGRCWDMLTILRYAIKQSSGGSEIKFAPMFVTESGKPPRPVLLRAQCHPDDDGLPTITIFKADEAE